MLTRLLLSILRAAHCRSTHHYFAVDALALVQTEPGQRLVGHLLRHYRRYLAGAVDPDLRFRDFQNHVVHVNDGYWGGAPRVAHQWYDRLLRYLRSDRYSDAAHATGVLCHYFTDPFQPFHTQSSKRESVLHRPLEWSITQSYDAILRCWKEDQMRVVFHLSDRPQWLGEAILHGARFAHSKYQEVIRDFDLGSAVKHPAQGLRPHLRASFAELFGIAITGWARVIERAALDAETTRRRELPSANTIPATLDAILVSPVRMWKRHRVYRREQAEVEALYREFLAIGELREHLPPEVDVVQRVVQVYEQERRWKQSRMERCSQASQDQAAPQGDARSTDSESPATLRFDGNTDAIQPDATRRRAA